MTFKLVGLGGFLPGEPISNEELSKIVTDSDPDWVKSRTGINTRYFANDNIHTSHMAMEASKEALKSANMQPSELDLIIVATTSPDNSFPSTATKIQGHLGCGDIPSMDIQAVCSGFIYGMELCDSLIASGKYKNILLVGAEKMSSLIDMEDRSTAVLFGDGAGAVILQKDDSKNRIFVSDIRSDGTGAEHLYTDGGVSSTGTSGYIKMNGQEIYRKAVEKMSGSMLDVLKSANLSVNDVDFVIPHQANERIIDSIASRLKLPEGKLVKTVSKYANNSAATIPLALREIYLEGKLKEGDLIIMTALGAGLTWGSCLFRW
jgi:3-oxoacyl-[acyl-carrier-protein] synthase-3